jgi:hypothetical protein
MTCVEGNGSRETGSQANGRVALEALQSTAIAAYLLEARKMCGKTTDNA